MPLHGISAVPTCPGVAGTNALGGSKLEDSEDARPAASDEQEKEGELGQIGSGRWGRCSRFPLHGSSHLHYDLFS